MCGMVGTKRFKFDVFSNDVNLANEMESTGVAGRVHVSGATAQFLGNAYILEEGEPHAGESRPSHPPPSTTQSLHCLPHCRVRGPSPSRPPFSLSIPASSSRHLLIASKARAPFERRLNLARESYFSPLAKCRRGRGGEGAAASNTLPTPERLEGFKNVKGDTMKGERKRKDHLQA